MLLPILFFLLVFASCQQEDKSKLVKYLEAIFYSPDFAPVPSEQFSVSDYGATGDGKLNETRAIQATIDAASEAGGGVVTFAKGTYLSGALFVKSNVELRLDRGVVIRAIHQEEAYPDIWTRVAGIEMYWPAALINVYGQKNVRITGEGIIDGNGKFWWDKFWGDPPRSGGMWVDYNARGIRWAVDYDCKRVRAIVVYDSEDVMLEDFTVQRSGFWAVSLTYSSRVYVNGLMIRNNVGGFGPSSDGINTDSSRDVLVENCDIDCNDDNLCIKAGRDADGLRVNRPAENIVYRYSITRAGHGLFTLGSETSGGMRNIEVYGLEAKGTNTGIRFKSARTRGGVIENIWFHDIHMDDVAYPFHFELDWYPSYSYTSIPENISTDSIPAHWVALTQPVLPAEKGIPEFKNLRISRVTAAGAKTAFHVNVFPEKPMEHVQWEDVILEADEPGYIRNARNWSMQQVVLNVPGAEKIEMENCRLVESPEYGSLEAETSGEKDADTFLSLSDFAHLLDSLESGAEDILVFSCEEGIIQEGDSLTMDTLRVIVPPGENHEFTFFEPLGDGFYYNPVTLSSSSSGRQLSIQGEQNHQWIVYLSCNSKSGEVYGAEQWHYREGESWIEARQSGASLTLGYR